jgi:hypothetical protein
MSPLVKCDAPLYVESKHVGATLVVALDCAGTRLGRHKASPYKWIWVVTNIRKNYLSRA